MTDVQSTCTECLQHVSMKPKDVTLVVNAGGDCLYCYTCPLCRLWIVKPCATTAIELLGKVGVKPIYVIPEQGGEGDPFTEDDIIKFGLEMQGWKS